MSACMPCPTHVYTHAYAHVYGHVRTHAYAHACTNAAMHVYIDMHTRSTLAGLFSATGV